MTQQYPAPSTFLNYAGDVRHMVGEVVGPNLLGEYLLAVSCEYDEATGRSRVGFVYYGLRPAGGGAS